jgi:butyrate kinase
MFKILVLNLGSTSSKVAVYEDRALRHEATIRHSKGEGEADPCARAQMAYRKRLLLDWLSGIGERLEGFSAIAARGPAVPEANVSGTYSLEGLYKRRLLELQDIDGPLVHGAWVMVHLTADLVGGLGIPVYVTDPASVNEMTPMARLSGIKGVERLGRFHALNQKLVARKHAEALGKAYRDCRFVVGHLGGGISVAAHRDGIIVDVNDLREGYGPFSSDRAGTVATEDMLDICFKRGLSYEEAFRMVRGKAGIVSHLGTTDFREVEARADSGDGYARLVMETMAYQISKEIGQCAAVLEYDLEAVILTGGLSYSKGLVELVTHRVRRLAPVALYPGEFENEGLALGAYRVLAGEERPIVL